VLTKPARYFTLVLALALASCATKDRDHVVRISVPDQKMIVFEKGSEIARYDVSTSKFGLGDRPGSNATPLGTMEVAKKIGANQPSGMKFKSRRPTGEIVQPNAPGRDPIVSRILWLKGLEPQNRLAFSRCIYIHGTAEEWRVGSPASYGCIRMRSSDVIRLFDTLGIGARVEISASPFPRPLVQNTTQPRTQTPPAGTTVYAQHPG
jgi:lipoprotein-anchoring transpeptidase ErfK/SrfK